jgi:DNA gyrase/topoisomerase IV subunit A
MPLVSPSILPVVQFISSGVFQAVMLPVLAYMSVQVQRQQDIASSQAERLQKETHEMVRLEFEDLKTDIATEQKIIDMEDRIISELDTKLQAHHAKLAGIITKGQKHG